MHRWPLVLDSPCTKTCEFHSGPAMGTIARVLVADLSAELATV